MDAVVFRAVCCVKMEKTRFLKHEAEITKTGKNSIT